MTMVVGSFVFFFTWLVSLFDDEVDECVFIYRTYHIMSHDSLQFLFIE